MSIEMYEDSTGFFITDISTRASAFDGITRVDGITFENYLLNDNTQELLTKILSNDLTSSLSFVHSDFDDDYIETYKQNPMFFGNIKTTISELVIIETVLCLNLVTSLIDTCLDTLEELYINGYIFMSPFDIESFFKKLSMCKNLKKITIFDEYFNEDLQDDDLQNEQQYLFHLDIDLMFEIFSSNRVFCNNLEKIHISLYSKDYITDKTINYISSIIANKDSKLKELRLYNSSITDRGFSNLVDSILTSGKQVRFFIKDSNQITEYSKKIIERLLKDDENIDHFFEYYSHNKGLRGYDNENTETRLIYHLDEYIYE